MGAGTKRTEKLLQSGIIYQFSLQFVRVLRILMNGYFLKPKDLGIFGIVALYLFIIESFTKTGTTDYLIASHKPDNDEEWDNAWTVDFIKYIFLTIITYFSSSYVATFFSEPAAKKYIELLSIGFLLNGFRNNRTTLLQKQLQINKYLLYNFIPVILSTVINLLFFMLGYNVLSLVLGIISQSFFLFILSYVFVHNRVKFYLNWEIIKVQFQFGKWIFVQTIVDFFNDKIDKFFIGKFFTVLDLGNYSFSSSFTSDLQFQYRGLLRTILFPLYSSTSNSDDRKSKFLKSLYFSQNLGIFIALGINILYPLLIFLVFGDKWVHTIWQVKILAFALLFNFVIIASESYFLSIGTPRFYSNISLLKTLLIVGLIAILGFRFRMNGVLFAVLLSTFITFLVFLVYLLKYSLLKIKQLIYIFVIPLIFCGIITILNIYVVSDAGNISNILYKILLLIISFIALEIYSKILFNHYFIKMMLNMIKKQNIRTLFTK